MLNYNTPSLLFNFIKSSSARGHNKKYSQSRESFQDNTGRVIFAALHGANSYGGRIRSLAGLQRLPSLSKSVSLQRGSRSCIKVGSCSGPTTRNYRGTKQVSSNNSRWLRILRKLVDEREFALAISLSTAEPLPRPQASFQFIVSFLPLYRQLSNENFRLAFAVRITGKLVIPRITISSRSRLYFWLAAHARTKANFAVSLSASVLLVASGCTTCVHTRTQAPPWG